MLRHRYVQKVDIFAIKYHYFCKLRPILNEKSRDLDRGFFVSLKNLVNFAKKNKNMTRILLTLSLICLIMTGCSNSNEPIEFEDETQTIDLAEYEEVVYKNRGAFI